MAEYDIKQVTRYVLVRKERAEYECHAQSGEPLVGTRVRDTDLAEFRRRDEAETVLAALHRAHYEELAERMRAAALVAFRKDDGSIDVVGKDGKTIGILA